MPLSMVPSQSLSLPSQISGVGKTPPTHESTPALHWSTPCLHSPTFVPQGVPTLVTLSSIMPLQLLSMPSQTSALGSFAPLQTQPPPWHRSAPCAHGMVSEPLSPQV